MTNPRQSEPFPQSSTYFRVASRCGKSLSRVRAGGRLVCIALLLGIMSVTAFRLFSGMTMIGMGGVDTFEYWKYANEILRGKHEFVIDRLSFYAINVLALKFLGVNDYAIRAVVGGLAVFNIALVYLLAFLASRSALMALAAATLYAFNPTVLMYAGIELPHVAGATFVLLAALFALISTDEKASLRIRSIASFIVGLALIWAVLTHEDLIFASLGYFVIMALLIFLHRESISSAGDRGRELALTTGAFTLGSAVGAAGLMLAFGIGPWKFYSDLFAARTALDENTATRTGGEFLIVPLRLIRNVTLDSLGWPLTVLAGILTLAVPAALLVGGANRVRMLLTLEVPVLVYIAGFLAVIRIYLEGGYQRLFVPLIALVIVFALCGAYVLLKPVGRGIAAVAVVACSAFILADYAPWKYAPPPVSLHRRLYDAVKDRVTSERKLLLPACYAIDPPWVGIGSPVYLGDNVVPIYLLRDFVSFDAITAKNHVGYVYVPGEQSRGMWPRERIRQLFLVTYGVPIDNDLLDSSPRVPQEIWHGDTRVEWSGKACGFEAEVVRRLLDGRGARISVTAPGVGDIYELPR